ncbi:hypothetical protein RFI_05347, partial [Reticulomyxa filosa]
MSKIDTIQTNNSEETDEKKETKAVSKPETNAKKYPLLVLMGDSVLDNFFWLDDKSTDLEKVLDKTFEEKADILNLAVDESTIKSVLKGRKPAIQYVNGRKENKLKAYPTQSSGKVEPLKNIKDLIESGILQHKKNSKQSKKNTQEAVSITKSDPTMKPIV